jgi:hypothetical protein
MTLSIVTSLVSENIIAGFYDMNMLHCTTGEQSILHEGHLWSMVIKVAAILSSNP